MHFVFLYFLRLLPFRLQSRGRHSICLKLQKPVDGPWEYLEVRQHGQPARRKMGELRGLAIVS